MDKRIDVLAVAIQAGMTVYDLEEMELAYAPQYGSAKDPINMAGFVAGGLLHGEHPQVDVEAILAAPAAEGPFLLDVRTPREFASGHIPGAVNLPVVVIAVCGILCGSDGPTAIHRWADNRRDWLEQFQLSHAEFDAPRITGGGFGAFAGRPNLNDRLRSGAVAIAAPGAGGF